MTEKLKGLIAGGEGLTAEFKKCEGSLTSSVFETVSSFSNRYGGYLILGVDDDGEVVGVNRNAAPSIMKNFVNVLNNPQQFAPTLFVSLEQAEIDGKLILWAHIPFASQIVMYAGKIFDRAEDGDLDVTRNSDVVAQLHMRKTAAYSERELFPYAGEKDLELERLMPKVRRLAQSR
ncbi:MAG: putative DNA binding domain-containing protein, partial [Clostridiales Family XIII bacterium]|nr:putative DNA binding domain-containing protein [Clostridiales Family XIII bacterium]